MSFLSDFFHGNVGNLGHDLNPSNIFSDTASSFDKQPAWLRDVEIAAPAIIGAGLTAGADLPAFAGLFGATDAASLGGAAAVGGADALGFAGDVGADASLSSFLADPAAAAAGGATSAATALPADALALTAPTTAATTASTAGLDAVTNLATDAASSTAAGGTGILDSISGTLAPVTGALKTAAPLVGAAGLGLNLYQGYQQKQQLNALNANEKLQASNAAAVASEATTAAGPLLNQGNVLMSYLTTNTLPPQFQSQLDQTIKAQKAQIIQGYASRGMSTNPQQNSQLTQDLAAVDNQALTLKGQMEQQLQTAGNQMVQTANNLLSKGLSATQLSAEIPIQLSQLNQQLNTAMSNSIANFAAAINGSGTNGKNITLNLGGGGTTT